VTISGKTEEASASGIYSTSTGAGSAGSITVQTPNLSISDSGEISSSSSGTGPGGSININVANLTMTSGAVISSASTGTGDAGNINLTVAKKLEIRDSTITTESVQADGGDITITTGFLTWLVDSSITATVGGGPQTTGGNIRINSPYIVLKESHVIANAYEGKGGSIGITADTYLADWTSTVSASSTLGISGQVDINSPLVNLSGLLSPLPTALMDITELLVDDCETRYKHRKVSSLVVRGRGALPVQPGELWPSPVMMR
jgi:large exoprotein involved in heme utilization and adhesion